MFRRIFRHEGGIFRQNVITYWKKLRFLAFQRYAAQVSRFKFALSGRSQRSTSFCDTWASKSLTMKNDFSPMFRRIFRHEGRVFRQNVIRYRKKLRFLAFQRYAAQVSRFKFALSGRSQRSTSFCDTWASKSLTMKNDFSPMFRRIFRHEGRVFRQNVIRYRKKLRFLAFQRYAAQVCTFKFTSSGLSQRSAKTKNVQSGDFFFSFRTPTKITYTRKLVYKSILHMCGTSSSFSNKNLDLILRKMHLKFLFMEQNR